MMLFLHLSECIRPALAGLAMLFLMAGEARADAIPYSNPWFQNPITYMIQAIGDGHVTGYYYAQSQAGFIEDAGIYDITSGQQVGGMGLANHGTSTGAIFDFGPVAAGNQLAVFITIEDDYTPPPDLSETGLTLWSVPALNPDNANHVYAASFAGDGPIPRGVYFGFEDLLANNHPDWNYMDEQFVLTNVIVHGNYGEVFTAVSEPETCMVTTGALTGVILARHRRRRSGINEPD